MALNNFKANPENFGNPIKGGELGAVPQWLKTTLHPGNDQPDPVRSLLAYFPELIQMHEPHQLPKNEKLADMDVVKKLEFTYQIKDEVKAEPLTPAQLILEWLQANRKGQWVKYKGSDRDMSFIKFLSQSNIKGEDKEDAIIELFDQGKIDISDDDTTIKAV